MSMRNKVIPFPSEKTSPEPDPIEVVRSRVIVRVGNLRYAIDLIAEATPLPPANAEPKARIRNAHEK